MHDQAAQGCAALPGRAGGGEGGPAHHEVQVGARSDDGRVVAAELEDAATEAGRHDRADLATHSGGTGGAHQRYPVVGDECGPHRAAAEHHLVEVGGHIHRGRGLLEQGVGGEGGERGQLARLPDHRVAADESEGGVPRPDRDREVERGDDGGGAEWVPLLHQPVARPLAGDRQPVELAGEPDSEVTDVDHLLHLAECFALDLAGLEGDQAGEVGLVGAQCLTEAPDQFTALGGRGGAPGAEGGGSAVDCLIDCDGCIDPPE